MGTEYDYSETAHQTIWDNIHGGPGAESTHTSSQAWYEIHNRLVELESYIDTATRRIGQTQRGAAADAAMAASTPLNAWTSEAKMIALNLSRRVDEQGVAFTSYRDSIPEVVPVVDAPLRDQDGWNVGEWSADTFVDWLPGSQTDEEAQAVAAAEAEAEARRQMGSYQTESNARIDQREQFVAPPSVVVQSAEPNATRPSVDTYGGGAPGAQGGVAASTGAQGGYGGVPGVRPGAGFPGGGFPGAGDGGGAGTPPMGGGTTRPPGTSPIRPGVPGTGTAGTGTPVGPGSGTRPGSPGSGSRPGSSGFGPGARGFGLTGGGPGGRGAGGAGFTSGPGSGSGALNPGGRTGTGFGGPGGNAGVGGSTAGTPGRGGAPGAPGAGPMGAGGSRRDDDQEHTRPSWLVEDDESAIVGELPPAPPPVIGVDDDTETQSR